MAFPIRTSHAGRKGCFYGVARYPIPKMVSYRLASRGQPIAGTQQMLSHGWMLGELGVGTEEHCVFSLVFPHNGIEISHLGSALLVKVGVGHAHDILKRLVVTEVATSFCCEILLRA